jgi:lipopolysaccharide transport system ATP-binding protein
MAAPQVVFDGVWKKFRRGERHDSLRDLIPATFGGLLHRRREADLAAREFWALQDVSFEVAPGEALGIIGPNGAGKSTALKLLTRILRPTRGHASVRGRVGALIEVAAGFHPDLTGRENIYLQGAVMGMQQPDIRRRLDEIVDFAGVGGFVDTPVKRYSSGMNARLGFAIAAHLDPEVLIIDEVLSVGDMAFQRKCLTRMQQFIADGVALVFVSHNLQAVAQLCRRALVLGRGQCIFDGPTEPALNHYITASQTASGRLGVIDQAFVVRSARLSAMGAGSDIAPHTRCHIEVELECLADVRDVSMAFEVERGRDMLCCYNTTTDELDVPRLSCRTGDIVRMTIDFTAHLLRGHYRVHLNARHVDSATHVFSAENVASFAVHETASYDGVVDLEPSIVLEHATAARTARA